MAFFLGACLNVCDIAGKLRIDGNCSGRSCSGRERRRVHDEFQNVGTFGAGTIPPGCVCVAVRLDVAYSHRKAAAAVQRNLQALAAAVPMATR